MFKTKAVLQTLQALTQSLSSMGAGQVFIGVPLEWDKGKAAYVALAGQQLDDSKTATLRRTAHFWVVLAVRVDGDIEAAETQIADWIDEFETEFYHDRTLGTNNQPDRWTASLDARVAEQPAYLPMVGEEIRLWPLVVSVTQEQTYPDPH